MRCNEMQMSQVLDGSEPSTRCKVNQDDGAAGGIKETSKKKERNVKKVKKCNRQTSCSYSSER